MGLSYFEIAAENKRWHCTPPSKERCQVVTRGTQTALLSVVSHPLPTHAEQLDLSSQVRSISLESCQSTVCEKEEITTSTGSLKGTPWRGGPVSQVVCCHTDRCVILAWESLKMRGCLELPDGSVMEVSSGCVLHLQSVGGQSAECFQWVRSGHCDKQLELSYLERPACQMRWL